MIKIQSKRSLHANTTRQLLQRLMCRRNHPHIHAHRLVIAHALQLSALQEAQHLRLQRHRHLADLIQKQRPPMSRFNPSRPRLHRPGKGSACVPKELSLQQCLRNRRTVQHCKRLARTIAQAVQSPRHDLLSRARLSFDQYCR